MACWVKVGERIPKYVGIPVQLLGVAWVRHNGIRTGKPAYPRQVEPGIVIQQPQLQVLLLPGGSRVCELGGRCGGC